MAFIFIFDTWPSWRGLNGIWTGSTFRAADDIFWDSQPMETVVSRRFCPSARVPGSAATRGLLTGT